MELLCHQIKIPILFFYWIRIHVRDPIIIFQYIIHTTNKKNVVFNFFFLLQTPENLCEIFYHYLLMAFKPHMGPYTYKVVNFLGRFIFLFMIFILFMSLLLYLRLFFSMIPLSMSKFLFLHFIFTFCTLAIVTSISYEPGFSNSALCTQMAEE